MAFTCPTCQNEWPTEYCPECRRSIGSANAGNPTESKKVDTITKEFWHVTWIAWKSGAIGNIVPSLKEVASVPFRDFLKNSGDVTSLGMKNFFITVKPLPMEFLIGRGTGREPSFYLTSQRLLLKSPDEPKYRVAYLNSIQTVSSQIENKSFTVKIIRQDGKEATIKGIPEIAKDDVMTFAIDRAQQPSPWNEVVVAVKNAPVEDIDFDIVYVDRPPSTSSSGLPWIVVAVGAAGRANAQR